MGQEMGYLGCINKIDRQKGMEQLSHFLPQIKFIQIKMKIIDKTQNRARSATIAPCLFVCGYNLI
jgi:hypothetical protein